MNGVPRQDMDHTEGRYTEKKKKKEKMWDALNV